MCLSKPDNHIYINICNVPESEFREILNKNKSCLHRYRGDMDPQLDAIHTGEKLYIRQIRRTSQPLDTVEVIEAVIRNAPHIQYGLPGVREGTTNLLYYIPFQIEKVTLASVLNLPPIRGWGRYREDHLDLARAGTAA